MGLNKLLEVKMNDEEIFELLVDSLRDITGWDDEITPQTLLIDDLGLDSLGFLDLFFTIQTSIQKEVTNEEMRNLILEELGIAGRSDIKDMSDGEKDRVAYPQLKVENFFNIVKKQLDPGLAGVDLDKHSESVFEVSAIESFLQENFERIREQKITQQIEQNKIDDPRMQQIIKDAFQSIDSSKVQEIVVDKKMMTNIVKNFLKDHLDLNSPEAMKRFVLDKDKKINVRELLNSDSGKGRIFNQFLDGKQEEILKAYVETNHDSIISQVIEARKADVIQKAVSKNRGNLVIRIFERRKDEILGMVSEEDQEKFSEDALKEADSYSDFLEGFKASGKEAAMRKLFEEEKTRIYAEIVEHETQRIYSMDGLSDDDKSSILDKLGSSERERILDEFVQENRDALKRAAEDEGMVLNQDDLAAQLLSDQEVQQKLIQELVDSQISDVFDDEIRKQSENIEDDELLKLVQNTFMTTQFKEEKIKQAMADGNIQGEVAEDFMRQNFDRIALEETRRILEDHDLRNKLIQDYIKDNYDPMEAMQLNSPEKMKELQEKITKKYIEEHIDEIIARYMNEYMDEMLEALPEEDEIEVGGDLQDEFMKKFMQKMEVEDQDEGLSSHDLDSFIGRYNIKDPMMLAFLETNFEDTRELFAAFEKIEYDPGLIETFIRQEFDLKTAAFLQLTLDNQEFKVALRAEFTEYFLTHHLESRMEEMMELAMKKQFDFLGVADERNQEMIDGYQQLLNDFLIDKIKEIVASLTREEIQSGFEKFFRRVEQDQEEFLSLLQAKFDRPKQIKILSHFIDQPQTIDAMKIGFAEFFIANYSEEVNQATFEVWSQVIQGTDQYPELTAKLKSLQSSFLIKELKSISKTKLAKEVLEQSRLSFCADVEFPLIRGSLDYFVCGLMEQDSFEDELRAHIKDVQLYLESKEELESFLGYVHQSEAGATLPTLDFKDETLEVDPEKLVEYLKAMSALPRQALLKLYLAHLKVAVNYVKLPFETSKRLDYFIQNYAKKFQVKEGYLIRHLIFRISSLRKVWRDFTGVNRSFCRVVLVELLLEKAFAQADSLVRDLLGKNTLEKDAFLVFMDNMMGTSHPPYDFLDSERAPAIVNSKEHEALVRKMYGSFLEKVHEDRHVKSFNLRGAVKNKPEEYRNLRKALSYLERDKIAEFENFFGKVSATFYLEEEALLQILETVSADVFRYVEDTVKSIENDIFVFTQNWILSQYDFLVADRIMEYFDQSKLQGGIIQNIQDEYAKIHSFRMFHSSFKGKFYANEDLDRESEKDMIKEFSLEYMKNMIKDKVSSVEGL